MDKHLDEDGSNGEIGNNVKYIDIDPERGLLSWLRHNSPLQTGGGGEYVAYPVEALTIDVIPRLWYRTLK